MENCRAQWKPQQSKPFFQESKSMVENQQSIGSLLWQISRNKEEEDVF
jgi:phage gp46-like protein